MLSEALDIIIENRDEDLWLILSGRFNKEQINSIKNKVEGFVKDDNNFIVIDLNNISSIHESVPQMFLSLLNYINGQNGSLKFVFKNSAVRQVFAPYKNIFAIYPDAESINNAGLLQNIKRQGIILSKKTGIRLSIPVAIFLLTIITLWFISMGYIIKIQSTQIQQQEDEVTFLEKKLKYNELKLNNLQEKIKPMEQLGIFKEFQNDKKKK